MQDRVTTVARFAAAAMVACLAAWAGGCLGFAVAVALAADSGSSDAGRIGLFVLIYGVVVLPFVSTVTLAILPVVVALLAIARSHSLAAHVTAGGASGLGVALLWVTSGLSEFALVPELGAGCLTGGASAGGAFWAVFRPGQRAQGEPVAG